MCNKSYNAREGIVRLIEREKKVCYLFVDNDNLFNMLRLSNWRINFIKFLDYLLLQTGSSKIRAFFYIRKEENESQKKENYLNVIKESGAKIIDIPITFKYLNGILKRICNADVAVITDMMDYQHHFDSIVLVSGDGDYEFTLNKLDKKGKKVYIVSNMNSIAQSFINNQQFNIINLEEIKSEVELVYN